MIEVEDLVKEYGRHVAVDGVSFSVARGAIVGVVGPNGAGKSTTLRILAGFLAATEGTARVAGHDVTSDSIAAWIAIHWPAEELILAKSTEYTGSLMVDGTGPETSPSGFVDSWLQTLVPQLPVVSWCNLRGDPDQRFMLQV